jgi:hypothetical protein
MKIPPGHVRLSPPKGKSFDFQRIVDLCKVFMTTKGPRLYLHSAAPVLNSNWS